MDIELIQVLLFEIEFFQLDPLTNRVASLFQLEKSNLEYCQSYMGEAVYCKCSTDKFVIK